MAERRWYRLHWVTWLAALLVGGAITRCQFAATSLPMWGSPLSMMVEDGLGWPLQHVSRNTIFSPIGAAASTVEYSWHLPSLLVNGVVLLLTVCSTALTFEAWLRSPTRRQFTLRNMLALTGTSCCLLALVRERFAIVRGISDLGVRASALFGSGGIRPFGTRAEGFILMIPVLFGLGCTIYTSGWLLTGLVSRLIAMRGQH